MSNEAKKDAKILQVKVSASEKNGILQFEGSLSLPSLAKTKLATKDGCTKFDTLSNLKAAARRVADRAQYEGVTYDEVAAQRRIAAKKSATAKAKTTTAPSN